MLWIGRRGRAGRSIQCSSGGCGGRPRLPGADRGGGGRGGALAAAAMASLLWYFDSFAHWCWWIGMTAYAFASYLCLLPLALFYRWLQTRSVWLAQCMAELVDAGDLTGDPASGPWHRYAVQSALSEARLFAGAWTISHRTGAPLADAVEVVARQARSERELSRRRRSAMAGPKATMTVLSALPLGGIGIGVATGVNPIEVVGASPVLQACVACGAALLVLGRWWSAQIMRAAERGD